MLDDSSRIERVLETEKDDALRVEFRGGDFAVLVFFGLEGLDFFGESGGDVFFFVGGFFLCGFVEVVEVIRGLRLLAGGCGGVGG